VTKDYTEADRPALLDLLKIHGPMNVPKLAGLLEVNPTAVRQQVAVLEREGLVAVRVERRKVGRPTHLYSLTPKAEALFPQAYGPIAVSILRQIREIDGDGKIEKILARRTRELVAKYRKALAGKSMEERVRELARIRDEEGYMAKAQGKTLTEHHCPIAEVAREFPIVCKFEKLLFEAVLGVSLERTDHMASGGQTCHYRATTAR